MSLYQRFLNHTSDYSRLSQDSRNDGDLDEEAQDSGPRCQRRGYLVKSVAFLLLSAALLVFILSPISPLHANTPTQSRCQKPAFRREWRSLGNNEKKDSLKAVNCLRTRPSRLYSNQTLFDDFPRVHSKNGEYSHKAAPFLSWHRLFLHTYEEALQQDCGYNGSLPYWDWSLDWENITGAPVWDDEYGFGKDGDPSSGQSVFGGHCVRTGPFANLQVPYLMLDVLPHCLSRGFGTDRPLDELANWIRPSKIEELLRIDDYEEFLLSLENTADNSIPFSIKGDFTVFTAPYDPVFFLHHANLDRLWANWQSLDRDKRRFQYHGAAAHNSSTQANINDLLLMGGLIPDVPASQVLDTRGGLLCYEY